jgi:hypothetical protein
VIETNPLPDADAPVVRSHIRRCTFRRVIAVDDRQPRRALPVLALALRGSARGAADTTRYDVECLYADKKAPLPLGDMTTARPICDACTAKGVFRADED